MGRHRPHHRYYGARTLSTKVVKLPEHQAIYHRIRNLIMFGTLVPGQAVTIQGLTEEVDGGRPWNRTRHGSPRRSYSPLPHLAARRPTPGVGIQADFRGQQEILRFGRAISEALPACRAGGGYALTADDNRSQKD